MPVKSRISRKPNLLTTVSVDVSGGMLVVQAATVLSLGSNVKAPVADGAWRGKADKGRGCGRERKEGRWRKHPTTGKMTSLLPATLGHSGGVAAGRMESGGLGVALPCASAKRSRLSV